MMKKTSATSVRQKLYRIAKELKRDYNAILVRFIQERFLYRLSLSEYKSFFILKGALLFTAFKISSLRPTKDIDFLGRGLENDLEHIENIIREICSIEYNDAILFDAKSVKAEAIGKGKNYPGVRIKIIAKLGTAQVVLWLDFGFGDKIVNGPVELEFPTLLDFEAPKIMVYSLESAIAEKFHACVKLSYENSRMKDFYDIHELASQNSFHSNALTLAIKKTFNARKTDITEEEIIFTDEFKKDKEKEIQWNAFHERMSLVRVLSFEEMISRIETFFDLDKKEKNKDKIWNYSVWKWE